jgi:hypothetical protein
MNKYLIILIIELILILTLAIIFLIYPKKSNEISKDCEVILKNNGNKKINFVFLKNNVGESELNNTINFFLNSEPFASNKDKINVFYAKDANCSIVQDYVFCYSKETIKKSSTCPNDYIIVLTNQAPNIRSSAYLNLISLNINNPSTTILHEIGHIFANLADEYISSQSPGNSKNCNSKCPVYENIAGCFEGCSKQDYYRSSENSVMKSLSTKEYKELNTFLINKKLNKYE